MVGTCRVEFAQMAQSVELLELKEAEPDTDGTVVVRGRISFPSYIPLQRGDECKITLPDGRSGQAKIKDVGPSGLTFHGVFS